MNSYWFGEVEGSACYPVEGGLAAMRDRLQRIRTEPEHYTPIQWDIVARCGIFVSRPEYLEKLRELCFSLAEQKIEEHFQRPDIELLQMVRVLDELDEVINLLTERLTEWYKVKRPDFSRKYRNLPAKKMIAVMRRGQGGVFRAMLDEIERMGELRTSLMRDVSSGADLLMPNCSALVGGLVAARLLSYAGGLPELARLPGSAIQVLGARTALFSHIRGGSPPPKHGIIFQHRRVHNASLRVRGRVSRTLAAKLGIAARLDYYRGAEDKEFLRKADEAVKRAGEDQ
jgi:nucleolar protein 56